MRLWCIWCIGNYSFWSCFVFLFFLVWWSIDLFVLFLNFYNLNERDVNRGLVPAVAEMRYLDRVKWLDLYGVDLHPVLVSCPAFCTSPLKKKNHFQNKNLSRFFYSCTEWTKQKQNTNSSWFRSSNPASRTSMSIDRFSFMFSFFCVFCENSNFAPWAVDVRIGSVTSECRQIGRKWVFFFYYFVWFFESPSIFGVVFFRYLGPSAILESSHFASLAV